MATVTGLTASRMAEIMEEIDERLDSLEDGSGLPPLGVVGQIVVNTGPGQGAWVDLTPESIGVQPFSSLLETISALSATSFGLDFLILNNAQGAREKIDLDVSGKGYVNHGSVSGTARPSGYVSIEWVGSVAPTNSINGDTWINTT